MACRTKACDDHCSACHISVGHVTVHCLHQMFVCVLQVVRRPRSMYLQGSTLEAQISIVRILYDHDLVCSQSVAQHTA